MTDSIKRYTIVRLIPGLILCLSVMMAGIYGADLVGLLLVTAKVLPTGSSSPVSGIFVAILLGIIIRNAIGVANIFKAGIEFAVKYVLQAGIILLGLRLSLTEALKLGAWGLPLIVACISVGLFVTLYFTKKLKQSERLGTLIANGTGICGVTAIMATAPVIKAKEDEISYAVANITVFGLIGMLFYPYLAYALFAEEPIKAGLFLGTAIHDTAQVAGSALIYAQIHDMETVIDVATITKLTRNLFIIAVIPFLSYLYLKENETNAAEQMPKWYKLLPLFILGFLFLSMMRTIGDATTASNGAAFGLFDPLTWNAFYNFWSSFGSIYLLGLAMAGVGLSTNLKIFRGMGAKPFYIGLIGALSVGVVSLLLIMIFGDLVVV